MRRGYVQPKQQWVKGHQDRTTPLSDIGPEGLLNMEVDKLATAAYTTDGIARSAFSADTFAVEAYSIMIDGEKVTTKMKNRIIDRCGEESLRQYLSHKHRLSTGKLEGINWIALNGYLKSMAAPRRATQVKLQHGWIPTNSFLFTQRRVTSANCPLCTSAPETLHHVRTCSATGAYRRERLARLCRELRGINTAPEIIQCWHRCIAAECGEDICEVDTGILLLVPGLEKALSLARRHQSILSWEGFLQGRFSIYWNRVQHYHERRRAQEAASHDKKQPWDKQALRLVCEFHFDLWQHRNDEVHGRTMKEAQQKLRDEVTTRVQELYAHPPILLARYPSILSVPLDVRLKRSTLVLQMWLKQVKQQQLLTDLAREKDQMAIGSIERFLNQDIESHLCMWRAEKRR